MNVAFSKRWEWNTFSSPRHRCKTLGKSTPSHAVLNKKNLSNVHLHRNQSRSIHFVLLKKTSKNSSKLYSSTDWHIVPLFELTSPFFWCDTPKLSIKKYFHIFMHTFLINIIWTNLICSYQSNSVWHQWNGISSHLLITISYWQIVKKHVMLRTYFNIALLLEHNSIYHFSSFFSSSK